MIPAEVVKAALQRNLFDQGGAAAPPNGAAPATGPYEDSTALPTSAEVERTHKPCKAHNLEIVGSTPARATTSGSPWGEHKQEPPKKTKHSQACIHCGAINWWSYTLLTEEKPIYYCADCGEKR